MTSAPGGPRRGATHRERIILSMLDPRGRGLEIGAGYSPAFPKAGGYRVETVDHLATEELRRKYRELGQDPDRIEEVDYVWRGEPLHDLVPHRAAYDFVFASNVIEHIPDIIGFLNSCDRLLQDAGVVVLAVPDKRYCTDVFRPISSTGDVIQAHLDGRRRHPPGKVFDSTAYAARKNGAEGWTRAHPGRVAMVPEALRHARSEYQAALVTEEYRDAHGWVFVPSSFRLVLADLHALGLTPMKEVAFADRRGRHFEFYVSIGRSGRGCPLDRAALCRRVLREQRALVENLPTSLAACVGEGAAAAGRWLASLLRRGRAPRAG